MALKKLEFTPESSTVDTYVYIPTTQKTSGKKRNKIRDIFLGLRLRFSLSEGTSLEGFSRYFFYNPYPPPVPSSALSSPSVSAGRSAAALRPRGPAVWRGCVSVRRTTSPSPGSRVLSRRLPPSSR